MTDVLQVAGSLGVGAFLGTLIFIMYRKDHQGTEDRLTKLLREDSKTREQNTKVLSELVTLINHLNGKNQ